MFKDLIDKLEKHLDKLKREMIEIPQDILYPETRKWYEEQIETLNDQICYYQQFN